MSDAMEPAGDSFPPVERVGLANEDQKSSLQGVIGVIHIAEFAPTNGPHHGSMAMYQGREGGPVSLVDEPIDELAVGDALGMSFNHHPHSP